jgi:hypothetical protein
MSYMVNRSEVDLRIPLHATAADDIIYLDYNAAHAAVAAAAFKTELLREGSKKQSRSKSPLDRYLADSGYPYAYYRGPGPEALIAPTIFSVASTPRIIHLIRDAILLKVDQVLRDLESLKWQIAIMGAARGLESIIPAVADALMGRALRREKPSFGGEEGGFGGKGKGGGKDEGAGTKTSETKVASAVAGEARRISKSRLRDMVRNPRDYVVHRTFDADVGKLNKEILPQEGAAKTNPMSPEGKTFLSDGLEGFNYGPYHVVYMKEKLPGLTPRSGAAGEWEYPGSLRLEDAEGWFTTEELHAARALNE